MKLFLSIIAISAIIYVVSSLYFSISGRILTKKREQKEDEKFEKQMDVENQLKVLTTRIGEVSSENKRLSDLVRFWMASSNEFKQKYDTLLIEYENLKKDIQKSTTSKKRNTKKGDE